MEINAVFHATGTTCTVEVSPKETVASLKGRLQAEFLPFSRSLAPSASDGTHLTLHGAPLCEGTALSDVHIEAGDSVVLVRPEHARPRVPARYSHAQYVWCVAVAPCGMWCATGDGSNTVRIWQTEAATQITSLQPRCVRRVPRAVTFTAESRYVIFDGASTTLFMYDWAVGCAVRTFAGCSSVASVHFSAAHSLVLASSEDARLRAWTTQEDEGTPLPSALQELAEDAQCRHLLAVAWCLGDPTPPSARCVYDVEGGVHAALSDDVIVTAVRNVVRILATPCGSCEHSFACEGGHIRGIAVSPCGRIALTQHGAVSVHNIKGATLFRMGSGGAGDLHVPLPVTFSPCGTWLVAAEGCVSVVVDITAQRVVRRTRHHSRVTDLCAAPCSEVIFSALLDRDIMVTTLPRHVERNE